MRSSARLASVMVGIGSSLAGCSLDFAQFHDDGAGGGATVGSSSASALPTGGPGSTTAVTSTATTAVGTTTSVTTTADTSTSTSSGMGVLMPACGNFVDDFSSFGIPDNENGWDLRGVGTELGGVSIEPTTGPLYDIGWMGHPAVVIDPCFSSVRLVQKAGDSTQYLGIRKSDDHAQYVDVELKGDLLTFKRQDGTTTVETGMMTLAGVGALGIALYGPEVRLYAYDGSWHKVGATGRPDWSMADHYLEFGAYNPYFQDSTHNLFDDFNTPSVTTDQLPP